MIGPSCKRHFTIEQFYLQYKTPFTFVTSQWQQDITVVNYKYLAYRVAVALLFFVTWIIGMVEVNTKNPSPEFYAKWLVYLTNWGYTTCTLQALISAGMLSVCVLATRVRSMPNLAGNALKLYKVYWVANTIATAIAFGITFMYWTVIYNAKTMPFNAMNYFVHGNNSVLMMIDLWMVSHPVRILHFVYPVIFGICYAVFSLIYYWAGGTSREGTTYIYTILNWNKPGMTIVVCLAVMAFILVLHIFNWCIHILRIKLHDKLCSSSSSSSPATPSTSTKETTKEVEGYDNEGMATIEV